MRRSEITISENKALVENDSIYIINNPVISNVFSIYMNHEIGESKNYRDAYNLLRESNSNDSFIIYINNYGGYVSTGLDIINSIRACQGKVYTCMTGPVYSMAPLIALCGEKIFVEADVFMMFHDYSGGTVGKGHEMQAQTNHEKSHFNNMFKVITNKFLTPKEQGAILKGEDVYIGREDIIKRLKKIGKLGNGLEVVK